MQVAFEFDTTAQMRTIHKICNKQSESRHYRQAVVAGKRQQASWRLLPQVHACLHASGLPANAKDAKRTDRSSQIMILFFDHLAGIATSAALSCTAARNGGSALRSPHVNLHLLVTALHAGLQRSLCPCRRTAQLVASAQLGMRAHCVQRPCVKPCPCYGRHTGKLPVTSARIKSCRINGRLRASPPLVCCQQVATQTAEDSIRGQEGTLIALLELLSFNSSLEVKTSKNCTWSARALSNVHSIVLPWRRPSDLARVSAPEGAPPVVILPGFGNCTSDYTAPFGLQEEGIAHFLQVHDFHTIASNDQHVPFSWVMPFQLAAKRIQRVCCGH